MRRLSILTCILVVFILATSTRQNWAAKADEPSYGGIYHVPLLNNPPTLDPAYVQDIYGVAVVQKLFDGLVQFSPELYVIPALAENWRVEDEGRTYRFFLRKNAQFHNGRLVDSEDVVFSLSRLFRANPPPTILPHLLKISGAEDYRSGKVERVSGLEIVDDSTLVIHLAEPYAPFLVTLGMYQAKIVPREVVGGNEELFGQQPVGTGPFKFVNWQQSENIRLEKFPDYYAGRPFLDGITFIIYPGIDIEAVFADFQNGKLEEMEVYGEFADKLKKRKDLQWIHRPSLSLQFYGINCQDPKLRNKDVRQALSMAIDRDKLISSVYDDLDEPAFGILPPGLPGYHPREQKPIYSIESARNHLEKALDKNKDLIGSLEITSNSQSPYAQAELNFVRQSWGLLGVSMEPKFIPDWQDFESYIESASMQIYRYVWFADLPDPDDFLRSLFSSNSQFNYMKYHDKQVDEMLLKAVGEIDPIKRASMYQEIEEKIIESWPIIPISYLSINYVYQPTVCGMHASPLGAHTTSYNRVWLRTESPQQ